MRKCNLWTEQNWNMIVCIKIIFFLKYKLRTKEGKYVHLAGIALFVSLQKGNCRIWHKWNYLVHFMKKALCLGFFFLLLLFVTKRNNICIHPFSIQWCTCGKWRNSNAQYFFFVLFNSLLLKKSTQPLKWPHSVTQ